MVMSGKGLHSEENVEEKYDWGIEGKTDFWLAAIKQELLAQKCFDIYPDDDEIELFFDMPSVDGYRVWGDACPLDDELKLTVSCSLERKIKENQLVQAMTFCNRWNLGELDYIRVGVNSQDCTLKAVLVSSIPYFPRRDYFTRQNYALHDGLKEIFNFFGEASKQPWMTEEALRPGDGNVSLVFDKNGKIIGIIDEYRNYTNLKNGNHTKL